MPSARYYREQAQVLLGWALATSDADYANRLTTRAMELLARANEAYQGGAMMDLDQVTAEFNEGQMRPRPIQQQQQVQPRKQDDDKN